MRTYTGRMFGFVALSMLLLWPRTSAAVGFGAKTSFQTAQRPQWAALGDLNGDGKLDVVTANFDNSSVSVLLGRKRTCTNWSIVAGDSFAYWAGTGPAARAKPTALGASVILRASVLVPPPASSTPADSVRFFDGFTLLATSPVPGHVAQLTLPAPFSSSRTVSAVYKGDGKFLGSISGALPRVVTAVQLGNAVPRVSSLGAAVPNPFRAGTSLEYSLARAGEVKLAVYSVAGRRVRTLVSGPGAAGVYRVEWDGTDESGARVAQGVYFARLKTGQGSFRRAVTLLR